MRFRVIRRSEHLRFGHHVGFTPKRSVTMPIESRIGENIEMHYTAAH